MRCDPGAALAIPPGGPTEIACSPSTIGVMADLKEIYAERDEDDPTFVSPKRPPKKTSPRGKATPER